MIINDMLQISIRVHFKLFILFILTLNNSLQLKAQINQQCDAPTDNTNRSQVNLLQKSAVESLFGQVAKTVVYTGASFARLNNRLLCSILTYETETDNNDQPTLFVFNNPHDKSSAFRIYADDEVTGEIVETAQFDAIQMTYIYVHGWLGGLDNELWLTEAKNAILSRSGGNSTANRFKPNVIIVDWSDFAQGSLYSATKNSFKVSRRLARLLEQLVSVGKLRPELMHCLGHSIGTHICGQAARIAFPESATASVQQDRNVLPRRRFGRITGLDPGGFCYELGIRNETKFKGLRPSDALLVDAYYSNRSPFGNKYQVAHYNVRLSNGFFQRPCSVWRNPKIATEYFRATVRFLLGNVGHNDVLTCDHYFATRFARQIPPSDCSYVAYACDSYRSFSRGRCGECKSSYQCYEMDFEYQRANPSSDHAIEQIVKHSSYFNGSNELDAQVGQPTGGVPYNNRLVYYMQIGQNEQHFCSSSFRVRVKLNTSVVDMNSFRSEWLTLSFLLDDELANIRDASGGLTSASLALHGPWDPLIDRWATGVHSMEMSGLDARTLTALFDFRADSQLPKITRILVNYNNESNRLKFGSVSPIESIELDYMSSSDKRIREKHSRSFGPTQFKVHFKRSIR